MKCGIILESETIALAIVDDNGEFVFSETSALGDSYNGLLSQIAATVRAASALPLVSAGISIGGLYLHNEKRIYAPHMPLIDSKPLKHDLQAALGCKISIASHGQTLCAGEIANHQDSNLFALYLDDDISAGMAISGRLATGRNGLATNIGHISLPWPVAFELDDQICWCGKTGCLTQFISCSGVEADFTRLTSDTASVEQIIQRASTGDFMAESVIQVLEDRIARSLALICNLIDPDKIILGGYLASLDRLYDNIPRKWPGYSTGAALKTPLIRAENDSHSRLLGAAMLGDYNKN